MDETLPTGALFIAPIQPEVDGKAHGTTHVIAGHRIVREGIRVLAMVIVAVHIVKQTADVFTQGVIQDQCRIRPWDGGPLRTAGADIRLRAGGAAQHRHAHELLRRERCAAFYGQGMEIPYTPGLILLDGADVPILCLVQEVM